MSETRFNKFLAIVLAGVLLISFAITLQSEAFIAANIFFAAYIIIEAIEERGL
jgi:uncharacterized membrane protein